VVEHLPTRAKREVLSLNPSTAKEFKKKNKQNEKILKRRKKHSCA
jgi:hypothetical protein